MLVGSHALSSDQFGILKLLEASFYSISVFDFLSLYLICKIVNCPFHFPIFIIVQHVPFRVFKSVTCAPNICESFTTWGRGYRFTDLTRHTLVSCAGSEALEVVDKFRDVYSTLYNSAASNTEMADLLTRVTSLIQDDSVGEVKKVTGGKVKEDVGLLKPSKGDISGGFTSDALINAPDILYDFNISKLAFP